LEADRENEDRYELLANDLDVSKEDIMEMEQRMSFPGSFPGCTL